MRKGLLIFSWIALAILMTFTSCEEVGPTIDLSPDEEVVYMADVVEAKQDRVVMVEEFTGVQCVNCPLGHEKTAEIVEENPGRVVAMAIHAGDLAGFLTGYSEQEFVVEDSEELYTFLGIIAVPCAIIDRHVFENESEIFSYNRSIWKTYVEERLTEPTKANLKIEANYNEAKDSLGVLVTVHYTEDVTEDNYISVGVIENKIVDAQKLPDDSVDDDYVHEHVLRDMLSPSNGKILIGLDQPKPAGTTIEKAFGLSPVPDNWVLENSYIYAKVHGRGESSDVLQAAEVHWP